MRKGFTLIELLVVIVIIGILVAIALPNFIKIKDKAKEAEVKQNLHAIQLALERYAVDSPGEIYPLFISGGDWTDKWTVWQDWVDTQGLDPAEITNQERQAGWLPAEQDMGDILIMEAYMPSYPGNPFIKGRSTTLTPHIEHVPFQGYPGGGPYDRIVGGRDSNKMWECFGPDWTSPNQTLAGDGWVHHIFHNPPYPVNDEVKDPPNGWQDPSGNRRLTGNFSYWPRAGIEGTAFGLTGLPDPSGYTLAGFGSLRTGGQDVFNRNGNYQGRYRTEPCSTDCSSNLYPDVDCLCNTGAAPNRIANDGGSDTVIDGVVITLDSGVDKKTGRVNVDVTE
jgi:prepilin-type N-terminal cleavage/methylation domain-containing protein